MKIRINDLARELEVKSKEILDALAEIGIKEKKTHSSSIEDDEAERIRRHFSAKSGSASAREKAAPSEIKPKIDLSKISKPGDVARLLKEREQQQQRPAVPSRPVVAATAPPAVAPVKPQKPAAPPVAPPVQEKPAVVAPKAAPAAEKTAVVTPPVAKPAAPAAPPVAEKPTAPPAVIVTPPAQPPAAVVTAPPATKAPVVPAASSPVATPPAEHPPVAAKPVPHQPIVPQRRMITPQTGPRPVYQAPAPSTRPRMPAQGSPGGRPQGGVVRGQPIFQRPRPSGGAPQTAPGGRPQFSRPGEQRRGPHPTSANRLGFPSRPGLGGAGAPPTAPTKPAGRAAPARRPGQRYTQRP